jgi:hypothetical protein
MYWMSRGTRPDSQWIERKMDWAYPFRFLVRDLYTLAKPNYFSTTRTGGLGT